MQPKPAVQQYQQQPVTQQPMLAAPHPSIAQSIAQPANFPGMTGGAGFGGPSAIPGVSMGMGQGMMGAGPGYNQGPSQGQVQGQGQGPQGGFAAVGGVQQQQQQQHQQQQQQPGRMMPGRGFGGSQDIGAEGAAPITVMAPKAATAAAAPIPAQAPAPAAPMNPEDMPEAVRHLGQMISTMTGTPTEPTVFSQLITCSQIFPRHFCMLFCFY
jgi:hypothetical protein